VSVNISSDSSIILINLDGLRKDKIDSCPNLKSFRDNNTYFSKMISVAPYTLAAHYSIFSGLHPSQNGVDAYYHMFRFKENEITTLAQLLNNAGYHTRCDVISENIIPKQGFDKITLFDKTVDYKSRHSEIINETSKHEKFFLFLHFNGIHDRLVEEVLKKYDPEANDDEYFKKIDENEIRYESFLPECDGYVKEIIKTVEKLPNKDKVVLIFFADHGASIGEKQGEKFYGVFTYDYTIKVFSIIHIPHEKPQLVNSQCRTLDLYPTIGNLANIPKDKFDPMIQGSSLLPLINNQETKERDVFVETGGLYGPWPSPEKHNIFCVRLNGKKLIYNDTPETWEFYDLTKDPSELHNEYDEKSNEISSLKHLLISYLKENQIETKISQ